LGQPLRIRLIDLLELRGETTVQALADELGATQQNMSKHLGVLRQAGILRRRREGRVVWYSLADPSAFALLASVSEETGQGPRPRLCNLCRTGPRAAWLLQCSIRVVM
jgi:ArsR family transcriptional regulator